MDKRAARNAYKQQKTPKGIYAIRCSPSGQVWVDASDHVDSIRNRIWFQLQAGNHRDKSLQAAWNQYGEPAFTFEVLENFEEDLSPLLLKDRMRERQQHWQQQVGQASWPVTNRPCRPN